MHRDAIIQSFRSLFYAVGSIGSSIAAFMEHTWPVLQWCLGFVSLLAAIASIRASIATHDAIKNSKK